ncbi:hypothetical protein BGZ61DRAFT_511348 [Ilyonectria robusta]|uniref:uncharacterized protein n=1 Tax=Ilyonectria robusta TaxID=1079257 RepID=UPI001E8E1188|nr:uncharacterized protein BGZ61DRAFT_511348 [Ilyonectria robusta]KAH8647535.1 hypothetical protein BGZ61DRAFT_511348 [Ilyonectria robusta]
MARTRAQLAAQKGRTSSAPKDQGTETKLSKGSATPGKHNTKRPVDALNCNLNSPQKRPRQSPRLSLVENTSNRPATNNSGIYKPIDSINFWRSLLSIIYKQLNSAISTISNLYYKTLLRTKGSFIVKSNLDITNITQLIVPLAESLTIFSTKYLNILIESINKSWNNLIPLTETHSQSDYSIGFRYKAKCSAAALNVADRQNAYSITFTVRAVAELFYTVKYKNKIYNYYPVVDSKSTKYYCYPIYIYNFTALDGKEK